MTTTGGHRTEWTVGDRALRVGTPFVVTVTGISVCEERGCLGELLWFEDPVTGEPSVEHARDFVEHPLNGFDREDR